MKKTLLSIALCAAGVAQAQLFHLGIDLSNPSSAVFTATGLDSLETSFSTRLFDGISLYVFFTPPLPSLAGANGSVIGTLRPATVDAAFSYTVWTADDITPGILSELNVYRDDKAGVIPQTFLSFAQALAGSAVIDLSGQIGNLPTPGTSGPILAGYSGNLGPQIGTWEITAFSPVPELPVGAHLALYGVGFAGVWAYRRSRKA